MKRLMIILIFICATGRLAVAAPDSTLVTVVVAGQVTSSFTGLGIPAQPVYILGDTFSTISIFDSAFTDALGYYSDTFLVMASAIYSFTVYTYDCQGIAHDSTVSGPNNYFEVDFVLCDSVPPSCQAGFVFTTDPMNSATVDFTDTSQGSISQWYWDFGDGSYSTQQHPSHTYLNSGTYIVNLSIFDSAVSPPCYSVVSQAVIVNILPMFNLGGQVFGGLFPLDEGYVVLYKPSSPEYLVLDTALLNTNGVYYFYQLPAGTYIAKAFAPESPAGQQPYFPTYQQSSLIWQSSAPIVLSGNIFSADISLYPVPAQNPGNAAVSGDVFLNTVTTPLPLANTEIILFDSLMEPIDYVFSGPDGTYSFDQLPEGYYYLRPEVPGRVIPEVAFQLGNGAPLTADVDLAVPGDVIGIHENDETLSASQVFPNPASTTCTLRLEPRSPAQILLQVIDISGRILSEQEFLLAAGTTNLEIPIQSLGSGFYFVVIRENERMKIARKMQVIKQ